MKSTSYKEAEQEKPQAAPGAFSPEAIGTRIEALAAQLGGKRELANLSGIHETQLYKYIKGSNAPSIAVAAALAEAGKVSLDWLILGGGSVSEAVDESAYAYIPLYDSHCRSGQGVWQERCKVLTQLAFTRCSLRKKGLDPANLSALLNDGDSMTDFLEGGDTVMIDESRTFLEGEGVYVILLDEHLCAKRLQRQFDGAIHIISDNKAYHDMVVPKARLSELKIVGRAVWAGGWLV